MNDDNQFGEVIESVGNQVKQGVATAATQITGQNFGSSDNTQQPASDASANPADILQNIEKSAQNPAPANQTSNLPAQPQGTGADPLGKTPQELEQIAKIKREIHSLHIETYYDPLVNPARQQEESVSEKIEREDEQKDWELKQKEMQKPPDLAVQRAQTHTEVMPGTSG